MHFFLYQNFLKPKNVYGWSIISMYIKKKTQNHNIFGVWNPSYHTILYQIKWCLYECYLITKDSWTRGQIGFIFGMDMANASSWNTDISPFQYYIPFQGGVYSIEILHNRLSGFSFLIQGNDRLYKNLMAFSRKLPRLWKIC